MDADASHAVERRLADEPSLRARLQALVGTWDLLDELPRATVDDAFAHTTVAMVAVDAQQRLDGRAASNKAGVRFLGAVVLAAAVAFGFRWGRTMSPSPNERLIRDLPVIERLDIYRNIDDIDFARALRDRKLFDAKPVERRGDAGNEHSPTDSPATEVRDEP